MLAMPVKRLLFIMLPRCSVITAFFGGLISLFSSTGSFALGLGDLQHASSLGEPLAASIEVISPEKNYTLEEIKVRQLSVSEAAKMGVELLSYYQRFEIKPVVQNGRIAIQLQSQEAVTEPFINLFIELKWPTGAVYREYTLLLDVPKRIVAKPISASSASISPQNIKQPVTKPKARIQQPLAGDQYRVQFGDSLSKIAKRLASGNAAKQNDLMNWLLANNPQAFIKGDPNRIKAAVVLKLPSMAVLAGEQIASVAIKDTPKIKQPTTIVSAPNSVVATIAPVSPSLVEPRLSLENADGNQDKSLAELNNAKLRERIRITNEKNDQLQRESRAIEARLNRLEGSDYVKSLERLVQLREQEIAELTAQRGAAKQQAMMMQSSLQPPQAADAVPSRWWLWLLLVIALLGAAYFYWHQRKISETLENAPEPIDADLELARLEEALEAQNNQPVLEGPDINIAFDSLFDENGEPKSADEPVKWKADEELTEKIHDKTEQYVPEVVPGLQVIHHQGHDSLDDVISAALGYCSQGDYDKAEALLLGEQQQNGEDSRITTALNYVERLQSNYR